MFLIFEGMRKTLFGRFLFVLILGMLFAFASCSKSTCPTYDENAGDNPPGGGKTKSGLYPKGM